MCSAVDFLPRSITLLMKRASTLELNRGSGRICRFGAGPLRGNFLNLLLLFSFCAVLRTALLAVGGAGGVERTTNDMVTNPREILDASAPHEHYRVLLQVVPDA